MAKQLAGEDEVIKNTYAGFTNTKLDTYLKAKGIKTIMSIGCLTNVCVLSTAMQGWFQGYYSIIPSDASSTNDTSLHEATLKNHILYSPCQEKIENRFRIKTYRISDFKNRLVPSAQGWALGFFDESLTSTNLESKRYVYPVCPILGAIHHP